MRIVRSGNPSFVTLIPKKMDASNLIDFRLISLIGCMYKIVAKVLANRLTKVVNSVISEFQSAFVGSKQILVLNEAVDFVKTEKRRRKVSCSKWTSKRPMI